MVGALTNCANNGRTFPSCTSIQSRGARRMRTVVIRFGPRRMSCRDLYGLFFRVRSPTRASNMNPSLNPRCHDYVFCHGRSRERATREIVRLLHGGNGRIGALLLPRRAFCVNRTCRRRCCRGANNRPCYRIEAGGF